MYLKKVYTKTENKVLLLALSVQETHVCFNFVIVEALDLATSDMPPNWKRNVSGAS
jgi:hypothetical protein